MVRITFERGGCSHATGASCFSTRLACLLDPRALHVRVRRSADDTGTRSTWMCAAGVACAAITTGCFADTDGAKAARSAATSPLNVDTPIGYASGAQPVERLVEVSVADRQRGRGLDQPSIETRGNDEHAPRQRLARV